MGNKNGYDLICANCGKTFQHTNKQKKGIVQMNAKLLQKRNWQNDYLKNKEEIIELCKKFIVS